VFGYYDDRFNPLYGYRTTRVTHILNDDDCRGGTRVIHSETFSGAIDNGQGDFEKAVEADLGSVSYCE